MFKFDPKFLKAAVYGANDGIITTFAVVAGVAGAGLSVDIIIVLGIANMVADGISMAVGDYLGERSEQQMIANIEGKKLEEKIWLTGVVTFFAFVLAGSLPLLPYFLKVIGVPISSDNQFLLSIIATGSSLFFVGSLRTVFTKCPWWRGGLEMFGIGTVAATLAYLIGGVIERAVT